ILEHSNHLSHVARFDLEVFAFAFMDLPFHVRFFREMGVQINHSVNLAEAQAQLVGGFANTKRLAAYSNDHLTVVPGPKNQRRFKRPGGTYANNAMGGALERVPFIEKRAELSRKLCFRQ